MGQKLVEAYARAEALGGLPAKIRLASMTKVTSTQAESHVEGPELLAALPGMMAALEKDFFRGEAHPEASTGSARTSDLDAEHRLRSHNRIFAEMLSQRSLFLGDVAVTTARVTEAAARGIAVDRASVWLYDERQSLLRCMDLFEPRASKHSSGIELKALDYPRYFRAIERERTIAAHDARSDARTAEFAKGYLEPLGITSMLDVPIWANGVMVGVLCHEHVGPRRTWNQDEETFAFILGNFVALAMENRRR